ncbi:MAG: hypothetical protein K0Q60_2323 [Microvirga sp.]|nr:hypothetical protein [Microvirga sp.]
MAEPESKVCANPACPKIFTRGRRSKKDWADQRYCSAPCARQDLGARRTAARPTLTKKCKGPGCPKIIAKPLKYGASRWAKTEFCSQRCFHNHRSHDLPDHKVCEGCGETYYRPEGQPTDQWKARRFCSRYWSQCPGLKGRTATNLAMGQAMRHAAAPRPARARPLRGRPAPAPRLRKPCAISTCPNEVVQQPEEGRAHFDQRRYCSGACRKVGVRRSNVVQLHASKAAAEARSRKAAQGKDAQAPSPRRKGSLQPNPTRLARSVGDAERAADILRVHGPVWPMCTIQKPHLPPSSNDTHWHVCGRDDVPVEEMLKEAGLPVAQTTEEAELP